MINDCLDSDTPFGIVLIQESVMSQVGCSARIDSVVKAHDDGRKDIIVSGVDRIRVLDVTEDKSYLTGDVEVLVDDAKDIDVQLRERLIAQHIKLLELAGRMPAPTNYSNRTFLSFFIAHNAGLTLEQKQDVLELEGEADRLAYLVGHLEQFLPLVEEVEAIRMKVSLNGHFKDFPPESSE